jgi:plastocyanin
MSTSRFRGPPAALVILATMLSVSALRAQAPDPGAPATPAWLRTDPVARTVTLDLEVAATPGAPSAALNGYREGGVRVVVPLGWTVTWRWHSSDSTATHSLVLMVQREKLPERGGRPAFTNAMTRMVTAGLEAGQQDETTFTAEEPGWYWLLCGVPDHALNGEWIELRVDPEAKQGQARQKRER